jgi:hypothetical protein
VHCGFYDPDMSRLAAYRFYNTAAYYAPPGQPLVVTFTVNDQNFEVEWRKGGETAGILSAACRHLVTQATCCLCLLLVLLRCPRPSSGSKDARSTTFDRSRQH